MSLVSGSHAGDNSVRSSIAGVAYHPQSCKIPGRNGISTDAANSLLPSDRFSLMRSTRAIVISAPLTGKVKTPHFPFS